MFNENILWPAFTFESKSFYSQRIQKLNQQKNKSISNNNFLNCKFTQDKNMTKTVYLFGESK